MDSQSAINEILSRNASGNSMSVAELRSLAGSVDANAGNATVLLYSGGVGALDISTGLRDFDAREISETLADNVSVKTIIDTEIGALLNDPIFVNALQSTALNEGLDYNSLYLGTDSSGSRVNDTSFWDEASARLVNGHDGDFRLVMPDMPDGSVAAATEIPALLNKTISGNQEINGIKLQDWQAEYDAQKAKLIVTGLTEAEADLVVRGELNQLIQKTSNADLADMIVGRDAATGVLHIDTNGHLAQSMGLQGQALPAGIDGTKLSVLDGMDLTPEDLTVIGKYSDLLKKAGIIGDVLGTAIVVAKTTEALNNGDPDEAGRILSEYAGEITGGLAGGAAMATLATGLLAIPGVNVGVVTGMIIVGAAGLAGGYLGGEQGGAIFSDVYEGVSDLGLVPYVQSFADNIDWSQNNTSATPEQFLASFKTAAQLENEFNVGNINNLLSQSGNEWLQDRQTTLSDGTQLFNLRDGDQINLPDDPSIPEGAVSIVKGITVTAGGMSSSPSYSFRDENGDYLGDVPAYFFDAGKISGLANGQVAWSKNTDGSFTPQTYESVEQSRSMLGERYADARQNGQNLNTSSAVESTDNGYESVVNYTDQSSDGRIYTTIVEAESDASGQVITGGQNVTTIREYASDGVTLLSTTQTTSFTDSAGRVHNVVEFQEGSDGNWTVQQRIEGQEKGDMFVVPSADLLQTLHFTGGTVGSLLGGHLADGDAYKQIIYSAFFKTVGEHFGTFASYLTVDNTFSNSLDVAVNGGSIQGTTFENPAFSESFLSNLQGAASGALAGIIVDEVGEALGIDGTIVGEVFDVTLGAVTTGVISGGVDILFNNLDGSAYGQILEVGFDFNEVITVNGVETTVGDYVQAQVVNALAAYVGNRLAGELIEPESETAALFGAAGSAFGAAIGAGSILTTTAVGTVFKAIGAAFGGPVGIAIGAFIGTVAGTVLGNVLGGSESEPSAWAHVSYDYSNNEYEIRMNGAHAGGDPTVSSAMAQQVMNGVNSIIDSTHGILRSGSKAPQIRIGYEGNDFLVAVGDGDFKSFGTAADAIIHGTFKALKGFDLVGGHAVVMRAWHNSEAQNLSELREDIETAEAFQLYLSNPAGILALMMDQPDSEVAQSWATILQRAAELELHLPHEKDLDGGWGEVLLAQGVDSSLIPSLEGDTITLTDPITGEETVIHHIIGPGYEIVRIEGTDGNDIIEVIVDGPSISYVDAGAGDDVVVGSEQADIIYGNTGDDTIDGKGGNDWLHGGAGNDELDGGAGDDLVIGGQDEDILVGGDDNDQIYGNAGNDVLNGMAGQDFLHGGFGDDVLHGDTSSVDYLYGDEGDDTLHGYVDDQLYGGKGNDTFILNAAAGDNSIYIQRNAGHDVVQSLSGAGRSFLKFDNSIGGNELFFKQINNDLKILVLGEDQSVTIQDYFTGQVPIEIRVRSNNYQASAFNNRLATVIQLVAIDAALSEQPTGQYNYMSDAGLAQRNYVWEDYWSLIDNGSSPITQGTNNSDLNLSTPAPSVNSVNGLAGNDIIISYNEEAILHEKFYGDSGDDDLKGGKGEDELVGGLGDDSLRGNEHDDKLYGGFGNDYLSGGSHNDILYGGLGDDYLIGGGDDDQLFGGEGNDTIEDYDGSNLIKGGEGDDIITTTGIGNNVIYGDQGSDTISAGDGNDTIFGGEGVDNIISGHGDDWIAAEAGNDTASGNEGDDVVNGGLGDDVLSGNEGSDTLDGGADNDSLYGGSGNDHLVGGAGDDLLDGGTGNDSLDGGLGNDAYYYGSAANGFDKIQDIDGNDKIVIEAGISLSDLVFSRSENDLQIMGHQELTIIDHFSGTQTTAIELLQFADSSTYDLSLLGLDSFTIAPVAQTDLILVMQNQSISGNVLTDNGNGVDTDPDSDPLNVVNATITTLQNGALELLANGDFNYTPATDFVGEDSFNYILQDGNGGVDIGQVTITVAAPQSAPTAQDDNFTTAAYQIFSGNVLADNGNGIDTDINNDAISVQEQTITTAQSGQVTISTDGAFTYAPNNGFTGQDTFTYTLKDTNGLTDTATVTLDVQIMHNVIDGTSSSETLNGTSSDDLIFGNAGNDTLYGGASDDIIYADDDDPSDDIAGRDIVYGGDGNDIIYASFGGNGSDNDLLYGQNGSDIIIGTEGRENLYGGWGDNSNDIDILDGKGGDDWYKAVIDGGSGQANLVTIKDSGGTQDKLSFGPTSGSSLNYSLSQMDLSRVNGDDLLIEASDGNFTVLIEDQFTDLSNAQNGIGIELLHVNTNWFNLKNHLLNNAVTIRGSNEDDVLSGDTWNDTIYAGTGNDTLHGGGGVDTLNGEDGEDVFIYDGSGEDTYNGGIGVDTVDFLTYNNAVWVDLDNNGVEAWTRNTTHVNSGTWVRIVDLNDIESVSGSDFDDKIWGDASDNTIKGNGGSDLLYGSGGNDNIYGGDGLDILYGEGGADTFVFESISAFNNIDLIEDFSTIEGDAIDVSDLISSYDPLVDAIADFVQITDDGTHSYLSIDADGGADNFVQIAQLSNATGLTDENALESNGSLIA